MQQQILELRSQNKTYQEIVSILGCSKALVSYYCGAGQKAKNLSRQAKNRSIKHPYCRKIEFFNSKSQTIRNSTVKSKILRRIYKKLWKFNGGQATNMITLEQILNKFGEKPTCYLTGTPIDIYQPKSYEFDHKIPVSKGGTNSIENLGITTSEVNRAKSDMTPEEFLSLCKRVLIHAGHIIK